MAGPIEEEIEAEYHTECLRTLNMIFTKADRDDTVGLNMKELEEAMILAFPDQDRLSREEIQSLFMKVDTNCDGLVDWEEFVQYMLFENQQKDAMSKENSDTPFPFPAREICKYRHNTLAKITYYPNLSKLDSYEEELTENSGSYLSCTQEGLVTFWGLDFKVQRTFDLGGDAEHRSTSPGKIPSTPLWITDVVCLTNAKKVAIATADREISFYDGHSTTFNKQVTLVGFKHCVLCMDYWQNPRNVEIGQLLLGDAGGTVMCMTFSNATTSLFDLIPLSKLNAPNSTSAQVPIDDLVHGIHQNVVVVVFHNLHDDWVRHIKYLPALDCFVSCANSSKTALFVGDIYGKKMRSFYKIRKGVSSFDYSKKDNYLVTGGLDRTVRIWSPYVTSKASSILKGHTSPVLHVIVNKDQILSLSKDNILMIWNVKDNSCLQTIPGRLLCKEGLQFTAIFLNKKNNTLLLGGSVLCVLEHSASRVNQDYSREEEEVKSHPKPLCGVLYNEQFKMVVSACHGSVVNVWRVETGEKVIMFKDINGRDDDEITALSFDHNRRRLLTGSRDGSTKIWNFNNGACLQELHPIENVEITGIVCPDQKIITVGWNHNIAVYQAAGDDNGPKLYNDLHQEDIVAVDMNNIGQIVTASYDGQVAIWNVNTGHVYSFINVNKWFKKRSTFSAPDIGKTPGEPGQNRNMFSYSAPVEATNRHTTIDTVLFLRHRKSDDQTATVLISIGGKIQAWNLFGVLLGQFDAVQRASEESVLAMASDSTNDLLLTGDSMGYIKVWGISDYCRKSNEEIRSPHVKFAIPHLPLFDEPSLLTPHQSGLLNTPSIRLSKSENNLRNLNMQPECVVSFRAHCSAIVSLQFVEDKQCIISASTDCSVRIWTFSGQYIGTFGQKRHWDLNDTNSIQQSIKSPRDVERSESSLSKKEEGNVLNTPRIHSSIDDKLPPLQMNKTQLIANQNDESNKDNLEEDSTDHFDIPLTNVLGKNYRTKHRYKMPPNIKLDNKGEQCVAFTSLPFSELIPIEETMPTMPAIVAESLKARARNEQQHKVPDPKQHKKRTVHVHGSKRSTKGCKFAPFKHTCHSLPVLTTPRGGDVAQHHAHHTNR